MFFNSANSFSATIICVFSTVTWCAISSRISCVNILNEYVFLQVTCDQSTVIPAMVQRLRFSINVQHLSHRFALTGGHRLKHRWERLPKTHKIAFTGGVVAYLWSRCLIMSKKKALHHCGNYCTLYFETKRQPTYFKVLWLSNILIFQCLRRIWRSLKSQPTSRREDQESSPARLRLCLKSFASFVVVFLLQNLPFIQNRYNRHGQTSLYSTSLSKVYCTTQARHIYIKINCQRLIFCIRQWGVSHLLKSPGGSALDD